MMNTLPTGSYPSAHNNVQLLRRNAIVKNKREMIVPRRKHHRQIQQRRRNERCCRRRNAASIGAIPKEVVIPCKLSRDDSATSSLCSTYSSSSTMNSKASITSNGSSTAYFDGAMSRQASESNQDRDEDQVPLNELAMMLSNHLTDAISGGLLDRHNRRDQHQPIRPKDRQSTRVSRRNDNQIADKLWSAECRVDYNRMSYSIWLVFQFVILLQECFIQYKSIVCLFAWKSTWQRTQDAGNTITVLHEGSLAVLRHLVVEQKTLS